MELEKKLIIIDVGVQNIHLKLFEQDTEKSILISNNDKVDVLFKKAGIFDLLHKNNCRLYLTGKLAKIVRDTLGHGEIILPAAALWSEAKYLIHNEKNTNSLGIIDLSASGYMLIAIDKNGKIIKDLLIANPRCGAGSGINLTRILQKLDIKKEQVDEILKDYLHESNRQKRDDINIRADRCGVFSSSATISDKNQGIPIEIALAVTMKSEVLKAVKKMIPHVDKVFLTGRVFNWQFMRDCAEDYLRSHGIEKIIFDKEQSMLINGVKHLIEQIGEINFRKQEKNKLSKESKLIEYPGFIKLKEEFENAGLYKRIPDDPIIKPGIEIFQNMPVNIGLDVGSTMAKILITQSTNDEVIFKGSFNNHGDTITTIKRMLTAIKSDGIKSLNIQNIGITGSGRYQVQKVLKKVYPQLADRIFVLVENYAHTYGSIDVVKKYISHLKKSFPDVNEKFCVLVDIGGEDTKVSIISLDKNELFDNVMNIKCSAGTGSLMDTLKAMFNISSIEIACQKAFYANKAYEINATCAVFLMENAKKMQALGYGQDEILASCNYAIVENMARTLWTQIELPENSVVLLHGQTMLSDPLPLAVTKRLQENSRMFSLIPNLPGHRACLGLIKSIQDKEILNTACNLDNFINVKFDKKIMTCRGAACGDKNACCSRTLLTSSDINQKFSLLLGGCTKVNELGNDKIIADSKDYYKEIWEFIDSKLPKSNSEKRLVIPRSFSISDQAFFLSKIFENLNIPTHVDCVKEQDILNAQPLFNIDVCAPLIGATGQFSRLASEKHGIIFVPQIDFLPAEGKSLGRTCTTNQGGVAIAHQLAKSKYPKSNFCLFTLSLKNLEPKSLTHQLYKKFQKIFKFYNLQITSAELKQAITNAIEQNTILRNNLADKVSDIIEESIKNKKDITVVCGREYILNPGIFDSHVGKLLRDKAVTAIPSYALDCYLDPNFSYIYWKNPHDIVTKINAIVQKKLHTILKNQRLKSLIKKIEDGKTDSSISPLQVSTFRCGPDTVIAPLLAEITKRTPSLLIQSDAMIKELAHLENRINTYINQLKKKLHQAFVNEYFEIKIVEEFDAQAINKETDVIYFPTLHDNRILTSIFRSAGFTAIDNYQDKSYDLEQKVRLGRKYAGDSVCAPLAGVFADMVLAVDDFIKRKKANDKLIINKKRILIFDNKGTGPCRQGQYFEMHKILLNRLFGFNSCQKNISKPIDYYVRLLVGHEHNNYNVGLEEWALIQSFQGLILHGTLHSVLLRFGANCKDYYQYQKFYADYLKLKKDIYWILENKIRPNDKLLKKISKISKLSSSLGIMSKYFAYGLYNNNGLRTALKKFSNKWLKIQSSINKHKLRIHIEGEAYMRAAQVEDIFNSLVDTIGFNSFTLNYSPLWCYVELLLEFGILNLEEEISLETKTTEIRNKKKRIRDLQLTIKILRNVLARPLYKASKVEMPEPMKKILEYSSLILPTLKPQGELPPYLGEAILKVNDGIDLFLNVAPEGCMVSSMGQLFTDSVLEVTGKKTMIKDLFTLNGEVNHEQLQMALLKTLGPQRYYKQ